MNITIEQHATDSLRPAARNPNHMSDERYASLREAIKRFGFVQPALVRLNGKQLEIVDGHHRVKAALELGMDHIPCARVDGLTDQEIEALRIGMNRLRGELDLTQVGVIFADLTQQGWKPEDLSLTGFSPAEIADLLATPPDPEDLLSQPLDMGSGEDDEPETPKPFVLEIMFASRRDLALAKKVLRKAGGGDITAGLLHLIGDETNASTED